MMHEVSLDRVSDILAKAEQTFAEIEDHAQEYGRATYEGARRVEEWARSIIEQDNEYSTLFVTKVDEINGTLSDCRPFVDSHLASLCENVAFMSDTRCTFVYFELA